MKCGILTYHNAHNYGAVLQAYALKKKIESLGIDKVKIINYRNSAIEERYNSRLKGNLSYKSLLHPKRMFNSLKFYIKIPSMQPTWKKQCIAFEMFINKYLLDGDVTSYDLDKIKKSDFDILIVGSDQIWTEWITDGLDPVYLLDFKTSANKVSYGASINIGKIPEECKEIFQRCLGDFKYISVREESLKKSIEATLNMNAEKVLDPTLLLPSEFYEELIPEINKKNKFVLAYFLSDDEELLKNARFTAKYLGVELKEIHFYKKNIYNPNYIADADPGEFLWYIKNAEFVLTNSFHGTVFSIIFHKKFYSIYRKDIRKDDLLKQLGISDRHKRCLMQKDIEKEIDYYEVEQKLSQYRKSSEQFILNFLKNK